MLLQQVSKLLDVPFMQTTVGLLIPLNQLPELIVSTLVFVGIGLVFFAIAFMIIVKVTPFSIRKELEDDQNTALAIV